MLAVIAAILFAAAWIVHGSQAHMPVWFDWEGLGLLGLACLALSGQWHPVINIRRQPPQ